MATSVNEVISNLSQGMASQDLASYAGAANVPVTYNTDINRLLVGGNAVDVGGAGLNVKDGKIYGTEAAYRQVLAPYLTKDTDKAVAGMTAYETPEYIKAFMRTYIEQQTAPFVYNAEEDSSVIAAKQQLERSMSELAGSRGFLYGSAQRDIVSQEFSKIAPMFEEAAYRKNEDFLARQTQLAGVIMQWDDMQAKRQMKANELIKMKADFIMQLSKRDLDVFKTMLSQSRFNMELELDRQKMDMAKKEQEYALAWKRLDAMGYADNQTAIILGIKPGTEATWAKKMIAQHQSEMAIMAEKHKYDVKMLAINKKIEMDLLKEQERVSLESELRLMETEYGFNRAMVNVKEKQRREIEAKRKAEEEAARKKAEAEAMARAEAAAIKERNKITLDTEYKLAQYKLKENRLISNGVIKDPKRAAQLLYDLYSSATISNPTYNRIIAEYGLTEWYPNNPESYADYKSRENLVGKNNPVNETQWFLENQYPASTKAIKNSGKVSTTPYEKSFLEKVSEGVSNLWPW
jgi:hypothetical protein